MVNKIPKNVMKKVYHTLTQGNADISFYTEAFVVSNKEWIMKKPITFAMNLVKINIDCRIPHRKYMIKGLVPGKKCIARIHRRPKVYQYAMALIRFTYIITDVFHFLLEYTLDRESIYQKIEEEYSLPGFQKLRKKNENKYKSITSIYKEISKELNVTVIKDIEIAMMKRYLIINPYVNKALEIVAYNKSKIIAIIETSYSVEDIKDILGEVAVEFFDIRVSSETKLSFQGMCRKFMKHDNITSRDANSDGMAVISANYNNVIKHSKRLHITPTYYRSAKEIMKSIKVPELTHEFQEVYQTVAGIELFSGQYNHKNIYENVYLYLAPAVYALLAHTYQQAAKSGAKVIVLCDSECIFATLYEKYFGKLITCIWSGFAGALPMTKEGYHKLLEDCAFIESYPADRIADSLGFLFREQPLRNCKEEFVEEAINKARVKDIEVMKRYLKNHLRNEKKIIVVDPMPGLYSLTTFREYANEIDPLIEIEEISISRFLKKDAKELSIFHQILQMDIPYMIGFYGSDRKECKDINMQSGEITFVQPVFVDEIKKKTIYGAMEDFCSAWVSYQRKNNLKISPSDINKILDYSKGGLMQLIEELGGGIL